MAPGEFQDGVHIGRLSVKMYRQDRLGARRNCPLNLCDVDVEGSGIDVGKHRAGAAVIEGGDPGYESERGRDHFISWSDARSQQSQMQRAGPRIHRYCEFSAGAEREIPLKL